MYASRPRHEVIDDHPEGADGTHGVNGVGPPTDATCLGEPRPIYDLENGGSYGDQGRRGALALYGLRERRVKMTPEHREMERGPISVENDRMRECSAAAQGCGSERLTDW